MDSAALIGSDHSPDMSTEKERVLYADAGDPGLRFILPGPEDSGGLARNSRDGHLGAIVGRGGSGKSILALQLVTELLDRQSDADFGRPHGAFYFTLEASPSELKRQINQFSWRTRYEGKWFSKGDRGESKPVTGDDEYSNGLYLLRIPSPAESVNALSLQIRQTIARRIPLIGGLAAIVIDPIGAVDTADDLRKSLSQLKELADTHRTFVFILTEKYIFERYASIEHYCQSIVHLEYEPGQQQHRRLYVQKARGQSFRSGYHQLELQQARTTKQINTDTIGASTNGRSIETLSKGIRIFPSVEAQSAYAHEKLSERQQQDPSPNNQAAPKQPNVPFLAGGEDKVFLGDEQIEVGSAVFLMGPPGTFKEELAKRFAKAAGDHDQGATIYVSFKAEMQLDSTPFDFRKEIPEKLERTTYFLDARSPLLTPEEVLFAIRNAIIPERKEKIIFRRAIVWGLRRLYDLPNFRAKEGGTVQFLEALVTLLKSAQITSLLVDWPDKQTPSTVPIVDLCQYIFLTRVCLSEESPADIVKEKKVREGIKKLRGGAKQVALLRAQRTRKGVHHNQGAILKQVRDKPESMRVEAGSEESGESFERRWLNYGAKWEEDLSLLS